MKPGRRVTTPHGEATVDAYGTQQVDVGFGRTKPVGFVEVTLLDGSRRRYFGVDIALLRPHTDACTSCAATPETGQSEGCPECEGIVPPAAP